MGNNIKRAESWNEQPISRISRIPCSNQEPVFPHKHCTRPKGHIGDHCNEFYAGNKWIEVWWKNESN
jgi:hypothetical protein